MSLFVAPVLRKRFENEENKKKQIELSRPPITCELIFDFVFSAAISRGAREFKAYPEKTKTMYEAILFFIHFQPIFWQWILTLEWMSRFGSNDLGTKIFLTISMCGVSLYNLWLPKCSQYVFECLCLPSDCIGPIAVIVYLRILISIMYFIAGYCATPERYKNAEYTSQEVKTCCRWMGGSAAVVAFCYAISLILVASGVQVPIWQLVIILELFAWIIFPWYSAGRHDKSLPHLHVSYVTGRFQRFLLLSISIIVSASLDVKTLDVHENLVVAVVVLLAPFIILAWQITYFDVMSKRRRHALFTSELRGRIWMFCHCPLVLSNIFNASAMLNFQRNNTDASEDNSWPERSLFSVSVALSLCITSFMFLLHVGRGYGVSKFRMKYRIGSRILIAILVLIMGHISVDTLGDFDFICTTVVLAVVQAIFEDYGALPGSKAGPDVFWYHLDWTKGVVKGVGTFHDPPEDIDQHRSRAHMSVVSLKRVFSHKISIFFGNFKGSSDPNLVFDKANSKSKVAQ